MGASAAVACFQVRPPLAIAADLRVERQVMDDGYYV